MYTHSVHVIYQAQPESFSVFVCELRSGVLLPLVILADAAQVRHAVCSAALDAFGALLDVHVLPVLELVTQLRMQRLFAVRTAIDANAAVATQYVDVELRAGADCAVHSIVVH